MKGYAIKLGYSLAFFSLAMAPARALNIKIVADNDFALFSGTSTSVNTLLFQNNSIWMNQLAAQSSPLPAPPPGDNYFYLLAMGGGAPEEIMGTIDGINITSIPGSLVSNNLSSHLSGYDLSPVSDGTYDVKIADVQAAFNSLTFTTPSVGCATVCNHYSSLSNGKSFLIDGGAAKLFVFPTPVPGPLPVAGLLSALHVSQRLRQRIRRDPR